MERFTDCDCFGGMGKFTEFFSWLGGVATPANPGSSVGFHGQLLGDQEPLMTTSWFWTGRGGV